MWIINWLPEGFVHLIFLAGILGTIAGFVLGFIPFISKYKFPIQILSLIILSLGVYLEGGLAEKHKWEMRVKEMELEVAKAEAKAAKVNVQIVEKVNTEREVIKVKGDKVTEYIDRVVKVNDNSCKIEKPTILAHNYAATNTAPPETQAPTTGNPQ
jgi:hypothetical protein